MKSLSLHLNEVRPHNDKRGVDLISDALPFGRLWYGEPKAIANAIDTPSPAHDAVIRVYDEAANVIETHEHASEFKEGLKKANDACDDSCFFSRYDILFRGRPYRSLESPSCAVSAA